MYRVSKQLEEFFHAPIPQDLWHYTSLTALEGMLSSGKIWATEARFTSDKTEYVFARGVATEYLKSLHPTNAFARAGISDLLKYIDISYENGILSPNFADVFVASFSAAKDLKSQWVAYGDACGGVSIAFDLTNARPPFDLDTSVSLAPCIYERAEQQKLINSAFSPFLELIGTLDADKERNEALKRTWPIVQSIFGKGAGEPPFIVRNRVKTLTVLQEETTKAIRELFILTSHCKNPMFHEENEWRLVLPRSRKKDSPLAAIKFREKKWSNEIMNIPYIDLEILPDSRRLPITKVMTGPYCDNAKVKGIVERYNYTIPVTPSLLPIR